VVSDPPKKDPPQETEEVVQETLPPKVTEPVQENVDSSEEVSGEWQGVLERVKTAMANSTLIVVSPSAIRPMKGQPREFFSEISLNNLRQSIRQVGQIQAGIVRKVDDGEDGVIYELLDGERRWRVVLDEEDMLYRAQLVDIDDIAAPYMIAAIANFNREGHTPIEISDAIHKLRTGPIKVPMPAIAEIFGFGAFWVGQMHGLQNLHPDVRAMLDPSLPKEKVLPTTAAIHISKLDKDFQVSLAERVLAKEISISRLRREVVKTGDEQGRPVRTREVKPSKVLDSFVVRCGESARNALDILDRVAEMRNREILPMDSPRIDLALKSLDSAIKDLRLAREAVSTKKS
jgi:ParB family chromosome partitioning protein